MSSVLAIRTAFQQQKELLNVGGCIFVLLLLLVFAFCLFHSLSCLVLEFDFLTLYYLPFFCIPSAGSDTQSTFPSMDFNPEQ